MARFTIPRDVYFGEGTIEELKNLKGKKAFVAIGNGSIKASGALDQIISNLHDAGMETMLFEGIESDPSIATVKKGVEAMNIFKPDWIVAIGGGSPIDAAKAMWIFYENPEQSFEDAFVPFTLPELRQKARFAAITTTSGTGTEVTSFSVLTDETTQIKYPIADFNITPDVAIVDTNLAQTMPPQLVAHTGMDALTHDLEAYVSTMANELTDSLAMMSMEMVRDNLKASFAGDKDARAKMHIAQCLAGMAFSNAILGNVHSMAHKTGNLFGVPHGCANAIYLPLVIRFNAEVAGEKYADVAKRLELSGETTAERVNALIAFVENLNKSLNIPATLKEFGVSEDLFLSNLENISEEAVADPCTSTNPRETSVAQMKQLFMTAYYGK